jgi:hypothetical protein
MPEKRIDFRIGINLGDVVIGAALGRHIKRNRKFADSPLEGDGFELPVREHRAMAPSHGFAAVSHREAALRGAPASHGETAFGGAAGFREAAAAMRSTHREMRCSAAVQAARYRAARRAAMRSAHCEIRPGENVTLQYSSALVWRPDQAGLPYGPTRRQSRRHAG